MGWGSAEWQRPAGGRDKKEKPLSRINRRQSDSGTQHGLPRKAKEPGAPKRCATYLSEEMEEQESQAKTLSGQIETHD